MTPAPERPDPTCDVPGCDYAARPGLTRCQGHIPLDAASVAYQEALAAAPVTDAPDAGLRAAAADVLTLCDCMGLSGDHERACISRAGVMLALRAALSRQAEKETA